MNGNALSLALDALLAPPVPEMPAAPEQPPPPERDHRRGLKLQAAPPDTTNWIELEDVEPMLMNAVTTYLSEPEPGYALLLAAPAGAGKTRLAVRLAEREAAAGKRVLYCGPRRDFFQDVIELAERPRWWYPWLPRQEGSDDQPMTCRWATPMGAWLARGYDGMSFCSNPRICGWKYVSESCRYHQQRERTEPVVFGQHAHAALGHPLMSQMSLLIGDELPLGAFLHPWRIPTHSIVPGDVQNPALESLLVQLRTLTSVPNPDGQDWRSESLMAALGGAELVRDVLEAAALPLAASIQPPDLRSAAAAEEAPYAHLLTLAGLLLREARRIAEGETAISRVRIDGRGLLLLTRRTMPQDAPQHLIWLDATGDAALYSALFGRPVRVIKPRVRLKGRVSQVWASVNNRGAVMDERPDANGEARGKTKQATIKQQIARILDTHGYQSPATVSYKGIGNQLLPGAQHLHFGGSRGTNAVQDVDALFVVGAPLPALTELIDQAAMLWSERNEPFRTEWYATDVAFTGAPAAHSVGGFWDDPDLTTLVQQFREAELVQAVNRARPVRRAVDIWLLTNVALPDLPVELVSLPTLFGALDSDGKPITGIDLPRWPEVVALADATSPEAPLTSADLMRVFSVDRKTALRWMQALIQTGRYDSLIVDRPLGRGPKPTGIVKSFLRVNSGTHL